MPRNNEKILFCNRNLRSGSKILERRGGTYEAIPRTSMLGPCLHNPKSYGGSQGRNKKTRNKVIRTAHRL